jgi:hypothetical protein
MMAPILTIPVQPTAVPDPQVIIDQFKQAAINAKLAGFDGVECTLELFTFILTSY